MRCFFIFCCIAFLNTMSAQNESIKIMDSTITWVQDVKLIWPDFQGPKDPDVFGKALTSYRIDIIPIDVLVDAHDKIQEFKKLTVKARFYKKQSWTTVPITNVRLLNHEQLHFDIAELFARKIRKEFKTLQKNNEARFSVYSKKYSLLWKACRQYQKEFDFETNHGRSLDFNTIWSEKIQKALTLLESYK